MGNVFENRCTSDNSDNVRLNYPFHFRLRTRKPAWRAGYPVSGTDSSVFKVSKPVFSIHFTSSMQPLSPMKSTNLIYFSVIHNRITPSLIHLLIYVLNPFRSQVLNPKRTRKAMGSLLYIHPFWRMQMKFRLPTNSICNFWHL